MGLEEWVGALRGVPRVGEHPPRNTQVNDKGSWRLQREAEAVFSLVWVGVSPFPAQQQAYMLGEGGHF